MFTDKIELKDFDKMDPEFKELLGHVLTIQADVRSAARIITWKRCCLPLPPSWIS